jgi:predicted negative regulator of RcsB-dependent stress response
MRKAYPLFLLLVFCALPAAAQEEAATPCAINDRACVLKMLEETADSIDNQSWRDQTLREIAKTYAAEGNTDKAISFIAQITTPDTKAMTIRGIGMAAAENTLEQNAYEALFAKLRSEAEKIDHPPSYAIALTYIAMAQAFAGDDDGAWKTAADMENDALRHKAYGETAEIQAEKGKAAEAMKSISFIDSEAFRNKAYTIVSEILANKEMLEPALRAAEKIENPYKKAQSLQYVLDIQKPREKEK